jgi:DNA polymerase II large subunit
VINESKVTLKKINSLTSFPKHYKDYNKIIIEELLNAYNKGLLARKKGLDPSENIETEIAYDLSDRVERMFNLPVANRLRELLSNHRTEYSALKLAEEVSLGKFGYFETEESLNLGIRIGLAIVTDGITVAPIQGISSVNIKKNDDGSKYISVNFAGPIRSAGGTEAAFTLIIADHIRKVLGLDKYKVNGWNNDETGRFVEELRIYEREVGNFQFRVTDNDIKYSISHIPVEINGVETDPVEVVVHRGLKRIETDCVRGGALRVINDGIIGRARKLRNLIKNLSIIGWEWLDNLEGGLQQSSEETNTESSHFKDVISGRPILSMPNRIGGFRLRYGRSYNTGLSAVGIHPTVPIILGYPLVIGTQAKLNIPGKGGIISFIDLIEPPYVTLTDGSFVKVESIDLAKKIVNKIKNVVHLGDILISYGDFLENNTKIFPSAYVEEWWSSDLVTNINSKYGNISNCSEKIGIKKENLINYSEMPLNYFPSMEEAINISLKINIPLHPKYLYYWNNASISEIILLRKNFKIIKNKNNNVELSIIASNEVRNILEKIGIPFIIRENIFLINDEDVNVVIITLGLKKRNKIMTSWNNVNELLTSISGLTIKNKTSTIVGLRIGRPEKAMIRKMKPPVHVLFPIGDNGGNRRDIIKASKLEKIETELINMVCPKCNTLSIRKFCSKCGEKNILQKSCPRCKKRILGKFCPSCKLSGIPYSNYFFPIREILQNAIKKTGHLPISPLKGVKGLSSWSKIPEPLEKGILRRIYNLFIYKDATIRFDSTNAPLTHFYPNQINISIEKLRKLGYKKDIHGKNLVNEEQQIELFVQDIIIPFNAAESLITISKFLDELLVKFYGLGTYYNIKTKDDLIGQLIVGLAPHTSVGILGRIIGYTNAQVCYAHPYWHSAKRRDCDGDEDAIMMLLDVLINFSKEYLSTKIGGLMDTPLLIQPIIIPKELQRQAHNIDVNKRYSLQFYEESLKELSPNELINYVEIVRNRLGNEKQFYDFYFTHNTYTLSIEHEKSAYTTLKTLQEKLDKQIDLAKIINAVNPDEVVTSVLNTHLLPDIIGNMKAYTSQSFRCKSCSKSYRRFPLKSVCTSCGNELQSTVTRGSVEKYLHIAMKLSKEYNVGEYLRNRFELIADEFSELFPKKDSDQLDLTKFTD